MLNKEKYAKEIIDIAITGDDIALKYNKPIKCSKTLCNGCERNSSIDCCSEKKLFEWANSEYKEPVLTEEEREYLSAVVKPFRKYVMYIAKTDFKAGWEKILVYSQNFQSWGCITSLPPFQSGTRFKSMELEKEYPLEELGL